MARPSSVIAAAVADSNAATTALRRSSAALAEPWAVKLASNSRSRRRPSVQSSATKTVGAPAAFRVVRLEAAQRAAQAVARGERGRVIEHGGERASGAQRVDRSRSRRHRARAPPSGSRRRSRSVAHCAAARCARIRVRDSLPAAAPRLCPRRAFTSGAGAGGRRSTYACGASRSLSNTPLHDGERKRQPGRTSHGRSFIAESPRLCNSARTTAATDRLSGCATTR